MMLQDKMSYFYLVMVAAIILLTLTIRSAIGYSAPVYTNVTLVLGDGAYAPPLYSNVTLVLGEEAEAVADSCTYSSGDWVVQCSDYCNITSPVSVVGDVFINGSGTFYTTADVEVSGDVTIVGACTATCEGGCFT